MYQALAKAIPAMMGSMGGSGGGLMGGGGGGSKGPPPAGMNMLAQGMQASQPQPLQTMNPMEMAGAVATEQPEKRIDVEDLMFSGKLDFDNPEHMDAAKAYIQAGPDMKEQYMQNKMGSLGTGSPHGQAQATQLGMSGMGMSQPQPLPGQVGMPGLMGMVNRAQPRRVPYRTGLMGG